MFNVPMETLDTTAKQKVLTDIAPKIAPITLDPTKTIIEVCSLPFYDEYKFYVLIDQRLQAPNARFMLYKFGDLSLLNWTNEPIYSVNDRAPIKVDRKTVTLYAKFFFHFVRGHLGRFIIVEKPEEVMWLPHATNEEKEKVNALLMPVTYKGIGRDNLYTLTATVVFKNALFRTDIKIAPYEMDVVDQETAQPEHFTIGQMKLVNEELLVEDLNVPVDPPPGEFG